MHQTCSRSRFEFTKLEVSAIGPMQLLRQEDSRVLSAVYLWILKVISVLEPMDIDVDHNQ